MDESTSHLGRELRDVEMQPTPPPPADFNMLHEQVTWLTKEVEALRHETEWMRKELQNARVDVQQARAEAQQARRDALQNPGPAFGKDEIKAADPPRFAGSHKELEGWIVACRLGIASQPSKFATEGKKVIWAVSFLEGPPRSWAQPLINAYLLDPERPPPRELASFDTLADALRALFGDPNLERNAVAAINNLRQTTSVAEYRARFAGHSQHTKMDGDALAPYFYRGLKDTIKDLLAGQEEWRTFEELQDRASRLDARLQARKVEREQEARTRTAPPVKTETKPNYDAKPAFNPRPAFTPAARGTPPTAFRPPAAPYGGPMPMELDSQYRKMPQEEYDRCIRGALCFTCKEYGHVSKDCPKRRTRITGAEMSLSLGPELPSENDDAQE
ncbi:MAG TPA: hypothetical protein VMT20_27400 [Terriglobia bacterium]|nr:hypothetical protein [Terriglobia bacterium]